jgi:hypothetical protein
MTFYTGIAFENNKTYGMFIQQLTEKSGANFHA